MGEVLTANTENCINRMTKPISVGSGIRHGYPFSSMAFILGLELLALKMRSTPTTKGVKLPYFSNEENTMNIILKFALYADDTTLYLQDKNDL